MNEIANKLVDQVLSERELYEDNARLRHGVPRRRPRVSTDNCNTSIQPQSANQQPLPIANSLAKMATIAGLAAAGGGIAAPLATSAIDAIWPKNHVQSQQPQQPQQPQSQKSESSPDPQDLIDWIQKERLK